MCDERERLIGYVYDEGDAEERQRVRRHLEGCEICREEIGGLQRVREDLLAWDVPDHGSVWKPFAPARVMPWWREVPGWALAAAATLVFAVGAAGGVATQALMVSPVRAAAMPAVETVPVSLSEAQLAEVEQRVRERFAADMQLYLASLPAQDSAPAAMPANIVTQADVDDIRADMMRQVMRLSTSFGNDIDSTVARLEKIEDRTRTILNGTQGPGHN